MNREYQIILSEVEDLQKQLILGVENYDENVYQAFENLIMTLNDNI